MTIWDGDDSRQEPNEAQIRGMDRGVPAPPRRAPVRLTSSSAVFERLWAEGERLIALRTQATSTTATD